MIITHATCICRKQNASVFSIHRYLVNKGYARMVAIHRGSYMSAHVLLNLLLSWGKEIK